MPRHITSIWLLTIALTALHASSARAEVRVAGELKAVQLEARDASVEDVMAALAASFGLQYRGTAALERRITGTYRGSLQHVLRRLLDGYDFIMKTNLDDVDVTVLSGGKPGEARAAMTPLPPMMAPAAPPPTRPPTAKERRQQRRN
jgi:hypothetical protein